MNEIGKVVRDYVIREYVPEGEDREITETTPLISSGLVDSFSMVSLLQFLEKKYSIHIPDADATPEAFDTIERIEGLVQRYQRATVGSV